MTTIILTLIAVVIVAGAVVLYQNHRRLLSSLALVAAVAVAFLAYWSAETIDDNDETSDVISGAPTAPPVMSTPDQ